MSAKLVSVRVASILDQDALIGVLIEDMVRTGMHNHRAWNKGIVTDKDVIIPVVDRDRGAVVAHKLEISQGEAVGEVRGETVAQVRGEAKGELQFSAVSGAETKNLAEKQEYFLAQLRVTCHQVCHAETNIPFWYIPRRLCTTFDWKLRQQGHSSEELSGLRFNQRQLDYFEANFHVHSILK